MATKLLFGIWDIVGGISDIFQPVIEWLADQIGNLLDWLIYEILKILYEALIFFYSIIDFIQVIFRKVAGLDTYYYEGQGEQTGDIVLSLFRSDAIMSILYSLIVVAIIMLFISTFVAIIMNQYSPDGKKTVNTIIGKALKALFTFIFVPVICYFGVYISNGLLSTLDKATKVSSSVTISGQVFAAAAADANRVRIDSDFADDLVQNSALNFNGYFVQNASTNSAIATNIDEAFASLLDANSYSVDDVGTISKFDYKNTTLVCRYYDLKKFNWVLAFIACFFIGSALFVAALGAVQRILDLTLLFAISPPFVALMPLDDGKAIAYWRKKFIEKTVMLYGTVVAINFFFILVPITQRITFFYTASEIATMGETVAALFNALARILFIICGAYMVKDADKLITEIINQNDKAKGAMEIGGDVRGKLSDFSNGLQSRGNAIGGAVKNTFGTAKKGAGWVKSKFGGGGGPGGGAGGPGGGAGGPGGGAGGPGGGAGGPGGGAGGPGGGAGGSTGGTGGPKGSSAGDSADAAASAGANGSTRGANRNSSGGRQSGAEELKKQAPSGIPVAPLTSRDRDYIKERRDENAKGNLSKEEKRQFDNFNAAASYRENDKNATYEGLDQIRDKRQARGTRDSKEGQLSRTRDAKTAYQGFRGMFGDDDKG